MEQYFDLNNVQNKQKVHTETLHLGQNTFVWYRWLWSCEKIVTWSIFTKEMIAHYEDTNSNTFLSQLVNIKQKGSVVEHIEDFQKLNIRVTDISDEHRIDLFLGTLKDNIQHEFHVLEPDSLEKAFKLARKNECKIMATIKREVFLLLDLHNLQGWHHNNWKKKEKNALLQLW